MREPHILSFGGGVNSAAMLVGLLEHGERPYPDLAKRAVEMERNADLDTVKGLGRAFSWETFLRADAAQGRLFPEVIETDCMCFDGEGDE